MKTKGIRNFFLILLALLGLGAIVGGGALIISPSGELISMPLSLLDKSPFDSYLIPGIILFLVLGLAPLMLIIALWNKTESKLAEQMNIFNDMHWSWTYTIYIAFALIIWIQLEMEFLNEVYWLHTFYMFLAIVIIFTALLPQIRNLYKK